MQQPTLYYSEKQRFRQWWIWVIVLIAPVILLSSLVVQLVTGSLIGDNPINSYSLFFAFMFTISVPFLLYILELRTEVRMDGVLIRFRPFHRKDIVFKFESIQKAENITYSPIKDYGGWGIRYGRGGKAYNVSGNKGVMISPKGGKKILIGSRNSEQLCSVINQQL